MTEIRFCLLGLLTVRERLSGLLMTALHRDSRQAGALAACQHARRVLVDEFVTEPGTAPQQLRYQVLTADPALQLPETGRPPGGGAEPGVSRQLPAAVRPVGPSGCLSLFGAQYFQGLVVGGFLATGRIGDGKHEDDHGWAAQAVL